MYLFGVPEALQYRLTSMPLAVVAKGRKTSDMRGTDETTRFSDRGTQGQNMERDRSNERGRVCTIRPSRHSLDNGLGPTTPTQKATGHMRRGAGWWRRKCGGRRNSRAGAMASKGQLLWEGIT